MQDRHIKEISDAIRSVGNAIKIFAFMLAWGISVGTCIMITK